MRNFIDIIESAKPTPAEVVHAMRERFIEETGQTPQEINAGLCFDFADELGRDDRFESVGLGNFMNQDSASFQSCDDATGFDLELLSRAYPTWQPPEGWTWETLFSVVDDGCHGWAYCMVDRLCYDIEAPDGVANPFDLPWFQRALPSRR